MIEAPEKQKTFEKVGPCLYLYTATGTYYALVKVKGRQVRRSLNTTDRPLAKRRLADLQGDLQRVDAAAGKLTFAELCDKHLATVADQSASTVEQKTAIVARIKKECPAARLPITKVTKSSISAWLAACKFAPSNHNHHLLFIRAAFQMAVDDKILAHSPVPDLKQRKREKPIRQTPTFEEFQAIVADIRAQVYNADHEDSADFIEFLGLAGLGQAEASAVRWSDIDWVGEQIIIFRQKTRKGFGIPLYPQLRPLLERLKAARGGSPAGQERVLRIADGKKALAGACRRLKLPAFSQRALRRCFIVRAIERGVDVGVLSKWQGHADGGRLILSTYSHVRAIHSATMAKLMSQEAKE